MVPLAIIDGSDIVGNGGLAGAQWKAGGNKAISQAYRYEITGGGHPFTTRPQKNTSGHTCSHSKAQTELPSWYSTEINQTTMLQQLKSQTNPKSHFTPKMQFFYFTFSPHVDG